MGGDGASGLAMVIFIVMLLMLVGAVALFALIGRVLGRKLPPARRRLVMLATALFGTGVGAVLIMSTFYERSWSPPPSLRLATAAGFDAPFVILLQDPRATRTVTWREAWLPFTAPEAQIDVPPSGIVRVRDFGLMAGHADLDIVWPDGARDFGAGGGPGPPGTGADAYMIFARPGATSDGLLALAEPRALAAYVAQREGGH